MRFAEIMTVSAVGFFWFLGLIHHWQAWKMRKDAEAHLALSIRTCAAFGEALSLAGYGAHDEAIETLAPFVEMVEEAGRRDRH